MLILLVFVHCSIGDCGPLIVVLLLVILPSGRHSRASRYVPCGYIPALLTEQPRREEEKE